MGTTYRPVTQKQESTGNYLRKSAKNYLLSYRCIALILELTLIYGITASAVIELAVREKYMRDVGPWLKIEPPEKIVDNELRGRGASGSDK